MTISAAQLMVNIGANPAGAIAGIEQVSGMMGAGGILPMAAIGAGAIMAGVGVAAAKMAGDFQSGLTSLVTGAGESQKNLGLVHDGILALSRDTGTSVKQLVDGMYMIESGGFHGANGLAILKAATEGAKVGSADLGVVADTVDTILKNYGEGGALSATQATNTLITTVANGKTHLEDLASSLAFVLPAGAAAGLGLKDVMGAMATLTSVGIPASESATYLRQTIIALEAPAAGAKKALKSIGITSDELAAHMKKGLPDALTFIERQLEAHGIHRGTAQYVAAIREISGGTRQMQGMLNLMGPHLKTFKDDVAKIGGASKKTGDQVQGWALVQQNANQQFDRAKEGIVSVFIAFGEKLLPIVTTVAKFFADHLPGALKTFQDSVGPVLSKVGDFFQMIMSNKGLIDTLKDSFKRLQPAIGPILTVLAALTVIGLAPLALLIGAVLGLVVVITHLGDILGWLGNHLGDLAGTIGEFFGNLLGTVGTAIGTMNGIIGEFFGNVFGTIGTFVGNVLGALGDFRDNAVKTIGNFVLGVLNWFGNLRDNIVKTVGNFILNVIHKFEDFQAAVFTKVKDLVTGVISHLMDMEKRGLARIGAFKDAAIQHAKDLATNFIDALLGLPGKMITLGENLLKSLAKGLDNARGAVMSAVKGIPLLGGIAGGINQLIPQFASGGTMQSNGVALVGEEGPELVRMPAGAQITPLSKLPGGLSGAGGGGGTLVIQLRVDGRKLADVTIPHLHSAIRNATGNRNF